MVLFITRFAATMTLCDLCAENTTDELMVLKFSYLRNYEAHFNEIVTYYIAWMVIYVVKMVHVYIELCCI